MFNLRKIYYKLVGPRSRKAYWSNSKFADFLRKLFGIEIPPSSATREEWYEYKKRNCKRFGYKLVEDYLNYIQDAVYLPVDAWDNIRSYINNRFIDKRWCLDTKLPKGQWHEMDTRILYGLFETLVVFVEQEKAHMQKVFGGEITGNPREDGLRYIDWEISLGDESPLQAATAAEVKELYLWWKDERPNRPDPHDASGWSEFVDSKRSFDRDEGFIHAMWGPDDSDKVREMLKKIDDIEVQYDKEDEEMLIRLIKIRKGLWT